MRMRLYEAEIARPDGTVTIYIVAPSGKRAADFARKFHAEIGVIAPSITVSRVDDKLPIRRRRGLDDMLETGPIGFASECRPLGWFVFKTMHPPPELYRIEDDDGGVKFIIASNADVATAVWLDSLDLDEQGCHPYWRITSGMGLVEGEQRAAMEDLIHGAITGVVTWDGDRWRLD